MDLVHDIPYLLSNIGHGVSFLQWVEVFGILGRFEHLVALFPNFHFGLTQSLLFLCLFIGFLLNFSLLFSIVCSFFFVFLGFSLLGDVIDYFFGASTPFFKIDLLTLIEVSLYAQEDVLEELRAEALTEKVAHIRLAHIAILELCNGILDYCSNLSRHLLAHSVVNLRVDLFLGCLSLLNSSLGVNFLLLLHCGLEVIHSLA